MRRYRHFTLAVGAANETRTRDPDLGKVVLYQLSYCRKKLFQPTVQTVKIIGNPLIADAKVLLFLELARDFSSFFAFKCIFSVFRALIHSVAVVFVVKFSQKLYLSVQTFHGNGGVVNAVEGGRLDSRVVNHILENDFITDL